ncbi:MAG: TIR domain-containing protein [Bradyrhizobium sp.]
MTVRIFISYAWLDNSTATGQGIGDVTRIKNELDNNIRSELGEECRIFMDINEYRNDDIKQLLNKELSVSDYFIVFLSHHYLHRENTVSEYYLILQRERELSPEKRDRIYM